MTALIVFLGLLILLLGLAGVIVPRQLLKLVDVFWRGEQSLYVAAAIRFVLGTVLILAAPYTAWPTLVTILGVLAFIAAFGLLFAGFKRVDKVIQWWRRQSPAVVRAWCLFAVAFGGVLVLAGW